MFPSRCHSALKSIRTVVMRFIMSARLTWLLTWHLTNWLFFVVVVVIYACETFFLLARLGDFELRHVLLWHLIEHFSMLTCFNDMWNYRLLFNLIAQTLKISMELWNYRFSQSRQLTLQHMLGIVCTHPKRPTKEGNKHDTKRFNL